MGYRWEDVINVNLHITHIFILLNPTPSVISKLSKNGTINIDKYPAPTILAAIDALCRTSTVGIVRVVNDIHYQDNKETRM